MTRVLANIASLKISLGALIVLAIGILWSYRSETRSQWILAAPLAVLAVNLAGAVATNAVFRRQTALLVFHIALVAVVLLVAAGRLSYLNGQLELSTGESFEGVLVQSDSGPLHGGALRDVSFTNHGFTIGYSPGVKRDRTRNLVSWVDRDGQEQRVEIGDQQPLVINGYSFYTTPNKGFAPIFTWMPTGGQAQRGTIHLPSYPVHEHGQALEWKPPGTDIKLWVMLNAEEELLDPSRPWQFRPPERHSLVVRLGESRTELRPGGRYVMPQGVLLYEGLTTWMGYAVFYDWTLPWLLAACLLAVASLGWHFWRKFATRPWTQ